MGYPAGNVRSTRDGICSLPHDDAEIKPAPTAEPRTHRTWRNPAQFVDAVCTSAQTVPAQVPMFGPFHQADEAWWWR